MKKAINKQKIRKKLKCPKCDRIISNLTDLKTHEITHKISQKQETHFKCEKCRQNFKYRFSHAEHMCPNIQERLFKHKLKNFSAVAPVTVSLEEKRI